MDIEDGVYTCGEGCTCSAHGKTERLRDQYDREQPNQLQRLAEEQEWAAKSGPVTTRKASQ